MLPPLQQLLFLIFAAVTLTLGAHGFYRLYRRIARGRADSDLRLNHLPRRTHVVTTVGPHRGATGLAPPAGARRRPSARAGPLLW